ncbi:MAG: hypothetical protein ACKO2Q_12205, partial [Actinomycetota bacterium]
MVAIRPEATDGDSVDELVAPAGALLPARQLAEHLQSDMVTKSHSVVLDAALSYVDDVYAALDGVAGSWNTESRLINVSYN